MRKISNLAKGAALVAAAGIYLTTGATARADFTWNMSSPTTPGPSHSYLDTSSTFTITAYGYSTVNGPGVVVLGSTWSTGGTSATDLYGKVTGGDPSETGLGLATLDPADHEILEKSFVQLDVKNLQDNGLSHLTMSIGSIQSNEGYYVWGSNTQGDPGKLLRISPLGGNTDTFTISDLNFAAYRYFSISASPALPGGDSDVLLMDGITAVPEPTTLIAGALLLLPFGGSTLRILRKRE
jgi:hypothetical protein